ncbi:MAG TPA: DoxX family membrane protein [Steroidobacteraceae bacterium]|nr:DoxX family membrane protein [Steroidobacteraceae bacterium]
MNALLRPFMLLERIAPRSAPLALLALRFALAVPFFRSGLTRWEGGHLSQSTLYLFTQEFRLHLFGAAAPYPAPVLFAHAAGIAELALPVLLVLGLGTRAAALALLVMTGIIQLTIPDGWANFHLPWAAMALALIAFGAGPVSVDRLFASRD